MAARSKGGSAVVVTGRHRLGGGKEKGGGGRGSDGFRVELGLRQRGVKWSERFEWIILE